MYETYCEASGYNDDKNGFNPLEKNDIEFVHGGIENPCRAN